MVLFKKWAKHEVKSYIYCVNQFLREKRHKKWSQECKQKQSLLKLVFTYFPTMKIFKNFIDKFLLYHNSLNLVPNYK